MSAEATRGLQFVPGVLQGVLATGATAGVGGRLSRQTEFKGSVHYSGGSAAAGTGSDYRSVGADASVRRSLGEKLKRNARENFGLDKMVDATEDVYRAICQNRER